METAKDILDKHAPKWKGEDCIPRDQALAAMLEIAKKACCHGYVKGKMSVLMKELFPEDIKDTSASGLR
jgi:hypothetical protein